MTKRKNKSYTTEFKQEAASLGITTKLIYNWKAKLEEQQAGNSLNEDERAKLKRLRKESSFVALCGVSPLDASSGKKRHRQNRDSAREAKNALWTIALIRMRNACEQGNM